MVIFHSYVSLPEDITIFTGFYIKIYESMGSQGLTDGAKAAKLQRETLEGRLQAIAELHAGQGVKA